MKKTNWIFTFIFLTTLNANAATDDVLSTKEFKLKSRNVTVEVRVRKTAVVVGMPYSLELRVNCDGGRKIDFKSLHADDSKNICDVKPKSPRLMADGESIGILVREVDSDSYNEQTQNLSPEKVGEIVPACKKQTSEFVFKLKDFCR